MSIGVDSSYMALPADHAKMFVDALPQLAWMARADGFIFWYNRRWHEYTGTTAQQMEGWGWQSVLDPVELPKVLERWRESIRTGRAFEMEFPLRGADGVFRPFLNRAVPVRDASGTLVSWVGTNTEISAQKQSETALRVSEARLRATLEHAAVGIAHVGEDGRFLGVNPAMCEITGYSEAELLGKRFVEITHPDDVAADLELARRLAAGEIPRYALEKRYLRKDGSPVWVSLTGSVVRDDCGEILYLIAIVQDISRRKAAEAALRESNERFTVISRATNDVLWDWNIPTGELWWSDGFAATFGPLSHAINTITAWDNRIHPEDRDRVLASTHHSIDSGAQLWEDEYRFARADGSYAFVRDRGIVLRDANGVALRMVGAMQDVTAAREAANRLRTSEASLRLALESAYLVAFIWDIPSNEVRRYHNTDEMLPRTTDKPDAFESIVAMVHPDDRALFEANVRAALRDPAGSYQSEFRLLGTDGKMRWLQERGKVEFGSDGKPLRLIGVSQDITERKQSDFRLAEAQQELQRHAVKLEAAVAERTIRLQELVNELGTFSYSISHDLRAPLRSIQGFAELLRDDVAGQLPEVARSHLDRIIRAAQRMDSLIRDVLEYSRITRADLIIEDVDPAEIVQDAIEAHHQLQPPGANIALVGKLPLVRASRPALMQAFSNLLGNAVKFVRPGVTPNVRVRAEHEGATVRIWIEDNGIGIAPQNHDRIWGMLERLNAGYEGTGVGLSIVRKAVERMGGKVGVVSALGEGSRFWIELPSA